ncbi:hypothetical protein NLJ89_g1858 [Agrocybe chaxingu]|uniref:AAA+ ATPase domain-containing protein n=1 Tax=Agrocybe chaxingu TaxID=84603 RepID=A0A9W8MZ83_9AGAR|nr:hypothetical protein NLJ89_g1858 [Agrocybe chaxingu]
MLSRSLKAAVLLRPRRVPIAALRSFATPSNSIPPQEHKEKEKETDVGKTEEKPKRPELPKGLEGFFQQYQQQQRKQGQRLDEKTSQEREPERPRNRRNSNEPPPPNNNGFTNTQLAWIIASATAYLAWSNSSSAQSKEITWQEFRTAFLDKGLVDTLTVINKHQVRVKLHSNATGTMHPANVGGDYYFSIGSVEAFERKLDEAQAELGIPSTERIPVSYQDEISSVGALLNFAPTLLLIGVLYWISRRGSASSGGGIFSIGKSRAKLFNKDTDVKVKFKDVAGMDEAKEEIMEFVKFLKEPAKYEKLGAKIPRGAILSGPPGTGKTLLAKATAGEASVPFLSVSGSEFVEMFVGVGSSRMPLGSHEAREDRLAATMNGNRPWNQLLVEMDGFGTNEHIVVLAGTNRPDVLDPALLRPGRFDRHITIDRPDVSGRKGIYLVHLGPLRLDEKLKVDISAFAQKLAVLTPGFSGADIANVCNEAALRAARRGSDYVENVDFETAIERVIVGLEKKSRVLSPDEKKTVAQHHSPSAGALGYAQYLPPDRYLLSTPQMADRICMTLGGRVSEEIFFGAENITTGAQDDLQKITRMAFEACANYGMNDVIGPVSYGGDRAAKESWTKPFSERTAEMLDYEVRKMITTAYERTRNLLTEHRDDVDKVARLLLEKEVITREDMIDLLGKRPFASRDDMDKWLDEHRGEKTTPPPIETPPTGDVEDGPLGPAPIPISKSLDDKLML